MNISDAKIVIVLPAYNAEKTLERTLDEIPPEFRQHIILVDDASRDGTVTLARKLGITVFEHPQNRGYGGNQKTCYREALAMGADIVVMVHPDHQYDARVIPDLVYPLLRGKPMRPLDRECWVDSRWKVACLGGNMWPTSF